ncbi:MAG: gamma-glutamyltransferase [Chloroflexi bacterium]|nr:gamma-glutamyltransferase [Chloroflexota bacterium]
MSRKSSQKFETEREPVVSSRAVVAANQPIASAAGISMLAAGGNVADAAVATVFTCGVVEPQMVGPLGGGYAVHRDSNGEITVLDFYAEGPGLATEHLYEPDPAAGFGMVKGDKNQTGHLASGIPGNAKGWIRLHELKGSLPLSQVLAPAISAAENGFPISSYLRYSIANTREQLSMFPESANTFLHNGEVPPVGHRLVQREAAESLRLFAEMGSDAVYKGPIGKALVVEMEAGQGLVTQADLDQYEVRQPEPIRGTYRGLDIIGTPLTSGGGLLNMLGLNILENFDVRSLGFGTAKYWHLLIETLKIMFADRAKFLGDPKFVDFPHDALLDKSYAKFRASQIRMDQPGIPEGGDPASVTSGHTTHLSIMAADGSAVTMTTTLNNSFGGRVMVPGTGLLINNNMALFNPNPGLPNSVGPYKRMLTATAATVVEREGAPLFAIGTPGGIRIFPTVLQGIINVIDHEMSLQEAVEAPRIWASGNTVEFESICDPSVISELERMGHNMFELAVIANSMNAVQMDQNSGLLTAATCWRGDGQPAGLSGAFAKHRDDWFG